MLNNEVCKYHTFINHKVPRQGRLEEIISYQEKTKQQVCPAYVFPCVRIALICLVRKKVVDVMEHIFGILSCLGHCFHPDSTRNEKLSSYPGRKQSKFFHTFKNSEEI